MIRFIVIVALLGYFVPLLGFVIAHFKDNWGKTFAKIKWWTVIYPLGVFGLSEFVMFFPAWYTRKIPVLKWIFWIWLDDSRFKDEEHNVYADDYWQYQGGDYTKEKMWIAYKWHIRNRIFNLDSLLRPKKGERKIIETVIDKLYMDGKKVEQSLPWVPMARLKYWDDGVQGDQVNRGTFISKKHSIFGKGYVWERIGKRLTFRYSFNIPFLWMYLNFIAGENDKRYVFSFKPKRKKPIK